MPVLLVLLSVVQAGCELLGDTSVPDWGSVEDIRYTSHVQFLMDEYCTRCHGSQRTEAGLDLGSWDGLMKGSDLGEAVIPLDAGRSRLYRMVSGGTGGGHPMDVGADTLSSVQVEILRRWIEEGAPDDAGRISGSARGPRVYVAGSGDASIWVIDPQKMVVMRVIDLVDLGFAPSARPAYLAATQDGSALYASVEGENAVLRFSRSGDLVGIADVVAPGPLTLSEDGSTIAVGRVAAEPTQIATIETGSMRPTLRTVPFSNARAVAIRPQADFVLAVGQLVDEAVMLPLAGGAENVLRLTGRRHVAEQAIFVPSGVRAFVTGAESDQVVVLDVGSDGSLQQVATVDVADYPVQAAVSSDGRLVAVASLAGAVTMFDAAGLGVLRTTSHPSIVQSAGVTFSEGRLFVSGRNRRASYAPRRSFGGPTVGTVTIIEPTSGAILRVLEVGVDPTSMTSSR